VTAVIAQFFYVGAQVGTWSYFIPYIRSYTHQPLKNAGYFLTGSLVAFCIGRFSSTYAMKFVRPRVLMGIFALINVGLAAIAVLLPGWIGLWAIFVTSFFMSLMFPTIFALGIKGLGPDTKIGGSLLIMAIIGGAAFTPIMGWAGSLAMAMLVPLCCYVFIAWYSFVGSRMRSAALVAAHLED
jgi:FHS family L-fucose permease-like MFS transporter